MKISIGNDHAGPDYKLAITEFLKSKGYEVVNHGTDTFDSVDYPDFGHKVANDIEKNISKFGIVICGSGNGIAMTVNKHPNVRCALCWTKEIATLSRQHNQQSMRRNFRNWFRPIEIVFEFLGFFIVLICFYHFRGYYRFSLKQSAQAFSNIQIFVNPFGNNITCSL